MHIVVMFINIGSYHAARLRAAHAVCQQQGWEFTAVQVTDDTLEHPWGDLQQEITFPLKTLLPKNHQASYLEEAAARLPAVLEQLHPSAVVTPGWGFPVSRAALRWCNRHRVPAIVMSESKWDDEDRKWWKEQLKSWLYVRKFDAALVGGALHRDYLVRLGLPGDRIFLGYDVVDNAYFEHGVAIARQDPLAARQRQPKIPRKPYCLAVTRFIARKNVLRLIDAYIDYQQQVGPANACDLVLCGSGAEESAIRQRIQAHGLEQQIHLPGFVSYQQITDWYGLAHALIHPALQEQWGLVINEACASGLPILCSQTVGACHELVREGYNGFIFDPTDPVAIAHSLLRLHQLRAEQWAAMSQASQTIAQSVDPKQFGTGLLSAIKAASQEKA